MPVWRCPHCATPQAEASRCWVCRRSTTSCVTCRHYRRGISGGLGLCGLDPRHAAVANTDVRACWVGTPPLAVDGQDSADVRPGRRAVVGGGTSTGARPPRTFVPVDELGARRAATAGVAVLERPALDDGPAPQAIAERQPIPVREPVAGAPAVAEPGAVAELQVSVMADPPRPVPGRWWLWGDPDPWPERLGERWA